MLTVPIEVKLFGSEVDLAKREVTFYGSAFGNRDVQGHRVMPGAYQKSARERLPKGLIKHFRNHQTLMGPMRHVEEDSTGLLCVGYVSKTPAGDDYLEQAQDGSLTHASVRAGVVPERTRFVTEKNAAGEDVETLELGELILREAGLVDLEPANPLATLLAVKSFGEADLLDTLFELPYILKSFTLDRNGKRPTAEERRIAKSLLSLQRALDERGDALKALLAPEDITPSLPDPEATAPSLATPADAEKSLDLTSLLESLRRRGRLAA